MRFILKEQVLTPVFSHQEGLPISKYSTIPQQPLNESYPYSKALQQHLSGRELLSSEIPFPLETLHAHVNQGYVDMSPGVVRERNRMICNRCGNENPHLFAAFSCARCGEQKCHYCRSCIMMGRISECTPLYSWTGPRLKTKSLSSLVWNGTLSEGQTLASKRVVTAIRNNEELLVWAVCGAGKTEVLFKGIEDGLASGKTMCIATPRTDVVIELAPRLKQVFPGVNITTLYGGSEERHQPASLYLSTTHQLFRFKNAFDVVIVDEVDAFPYSADRTLQFAVKKSLKPQSSLIYLTATPSKQWKKDVAAQKRKAVKVPVRFHGHPLPVPVFHWCGNWQRALKKGRLPSNVWSWIKEQLQRKRRTFLFVPSVQLIEQVVRLCRTLDNRIAGVHAEDPKRKEKVQKFRNGEIPIMITSTILERGVTIPNCDVAVLGSENDIFTESALVQISGRVGRSADDPSGDIPFFHYGKTEAMLDARRHIVEMNNTAKQMGGR